MMMCLSFSSYNYSVLYFAFESRFSLCLYENESVYPGVCVCLCESIRGLRPVHS